MLGSFLYLFLISNSGYIGSIKQIPNTIFALGFGGNGITFSQIAAEIICDEAKGKKNVDTKIFSFERAKEFFKI